MIRYLYVAHRIIAAPLECGNCSVLLFLFTFLRYCFEGLPVIHKSKQGMYLCFHTFSVVLHPFNFCSCVKSYVYLQNVMGFTENDKKRKQTFSVL